MTPERGTVPFSPPPEAVTTKYQMLVDRLKAMNKVLVAYSGGVDSTLLLAAAVEALGHDALAITIHSPLHSMREIKKAEDRARKLGAQHMTVHVDLLSDQDIQANEPDRCYFCKTTLFTHLKELAAKGNLNVVVEGSNVSDLDDFRPGLKAIRELGIHSPLREVGFSKDEIRTMLKAKEFPGWDDPSNSCLAARIPYGEELSYESLARIEAAEEALHELGFRLVRVRHHGPVARIELSQEEINRAAIDRTRRKIVGALTRAGFQYVCLDLQGYRTGSMNELLDRASSRE